MPAPTVTFFSTQYGADLDVVGELDRAFEHAADVDPHVAAASERAAHVDARGVGKRGARLHQRVGGARLHDALDRRQLRAVVDAEHVRFVGGDVRLDRDALAHRHRDDVGQVELALRIVVVERRDKAAEQRGRRRQRTRVDLVDRALTGARVLLLDDRADRA